jgi:hypothetical protein
MCTSISNQDIEVTMVVYLVGTHVPNSYTEFKTIKF